MPQIFHPSANTIAKASIFGAVLVACFTGYCTMGYDRSPWHTGVGDRKHQPVPFSHQHHVAGLGIDCRYCHTSVESSHFAGIPPTKTCMTCHSQIWTNADLLKPVRDSWNTQQPIQWQRIHNLPEFVYFNHSIHVAKGIGCVSCHGRVDSMPLMYQVGALTMEWCLNCHRNPENYIRPTDEIYNLTYDPATDPKHPGMTQATLGPKLVADYHINTFGQLTNCSVCHR
jgi:hypothetical protein